MQSANLKVTLENFDEGREAAFRKDSLINLSSNNLKSEGDD